MKDGFVTLIGLLIAVFIIAIFIWGRGNKEGDPKGQIDTYNNAIEDAENLKGKLESSRN